MQSWKARLLMLLSTMAMMLAMSMPVVAQAQDGPWDDDRGDEWYEDWRDDYYDDDDNGDDYYGDDYYGDDSYDTFDVGGAECVVFYDEDGDGYEDVICFDEYGAVVYED